MKKTLFFLLPILILSSSVFSQRNLTKTNKDKQFTKFDVKKPDKYGEDLVSYFETYTNVEIQTLITEFISAYNSYPLDKKSQIIKTSNFYIKKRASKSPHFTNYFKIVLLMSESGRDPNNYKVLEEMIETILIKQRKSIKTVDDLIKSLQLLHKEDVLYSNRNIIKWRTSAKDFKLVFDKILKIEYSTTDLICNDPTDSLTISNTSGVFLVKTHIWEGTGGKVSWEKAGLPLNEVYAEIDKYKIDLSKREYRVKSVNFSHSKYFTAPVKGNLHDKLQKVSSTDKRTYPRFEAFDRVSIKEVVKNVDYEGPFTMKGNKFSGVNTQNDFAYIEVKKADSVVVYANSRAFTFEEENIRGQNTKIIIPIAGKGKAIEHPSVLFYYKIDTLKGNQRKIDMVRSDKGMGKSPFFNTFHNLEMDVEQLLWYIDSSKIEFNNLRGPISASGTFKTLDNFDIRDFRKMQLADRRHPLRILKKYSERYKTNGKIDVKGLARYTKRTEAQTVQMLLEVAYKGFIEFDPIAGTGKILPRLYKYLEFERVYRKQEAGAQFDVLSVNSQIDTVSAATKTSKIASLDIENKGLSISNVESVPLSTEHNVECIPDSGVIVMEEDRNFTFSGELRTEFLEFKGSGFAFDFKEFKFDLKSIDFLRILIRSDTLQIIDYDDNNDLYIPYDPNRPDEDYRGLGIDKRFVYHYEDSTGKKGYLLKKIVQSRIQDITGELFVDDILNKSGKLRDSFPQYPKFRCTDTSFVYYDKYYDKYDKEVEILGGMYNREDFYFQLDTFSVDSLGDFTSTSWNSPGIFHSSIFPDFYESLTIQVDTMLSKSASYERTEADYETIFSLGFVRPDSTTYDVYKGVGQEQGVAFNSLKLSNKGLHGTGHLKYLTAKIESSDFVYFPEFMVTDAFSTTVEESDDGTEYAASMGIDNFIEWLPAQDSLVISSGLIIDTVRDRSSHWEIIEADITTKIREPIEMYNGQAVLTGQSILTPSAHVGWGTMEFSNSELTSDWFTFKMNVYDADTADFLIKPTGFIVPAFSAFNVNSHIDYGESKGHFESNGKSSKAVFPINQFMTRMDQFDWDIDKNEIEVGVGGVADSARVGSEYISIHPTQDSLRFISYSSGYSLEDFILRCYDVDSINISNGTLYPDTTIVIKENAEIDPVANSVLIADTINRYHKIRDAVITVLGAKELKGLGSYDYDFMEKDQNGQDSLVTYEIRFDGIRATRNDSIIRAYGKIEEKRKINLSDNFVNFIGNVELFTNEKFIKFKGAVSINSDTTLLRPESIRFEGLIDPDSTVLEYIAEPSNASGSRITSGFFSTKDSLYSSFLSKRRNINDTPFFLDSGILYYNKQNHEYIISSKEKYLNPDTIGNVLAFNNRYSYMTAMGELELGANLGQVAIRTIGNAKNNLKKKEITLRTFLSVDFFFNDKASKLMAETIFESTTLSGIKSSDIYTEAIKNLVGTRKAEKLAKEQSLYGQFKKMPLELEKLFVFSELNFAWDTLTHSYRTPKDGKLNLVGIKDNQLNKSVPGYVEIIKKKARDEISILLELNLTEWFFFQYIGGRMYAVSSNIEFNSLMTEGKESERKQEFEKGEKGVDFIYQIGTSAYRDEFVAKMRGESILDSEDLPYNDDLDDNGDDNVDDVDVDDDEPSPESEEEDNDYDGE